MARRVTWLDVFTSTPMAGNALAVVHDADGLDDAAMLAFARETRLSETTFVQSGADGADYINRIYTMMGELRFAGHPSLGTAVAVARERGLDRASFVQRTPAGLQPIEVQLDGDRATASMLQEPAEFGAPLDDAAAALAAVGLEPGDAHPSLPVQPVSTGIFHVMVPVRDAAALERARPETAALTTLTGATGAIVAYCFVADEAAGTARARGFFLSPGGAIEDPATGSAAGPLCAYLSRHRGMGAVAIDQGAEMGRPSRLDTAIDGETVRVSGACVVVLDGDLLV